MQYLSFHFIFTVDSFTLLTLISLVWANCGKPEAVDHAFPKDAELDRYPANSEVFFECDAGYGNVKKNANGKSACQQIGSQYSWSPPELDCQLLTCSPPGHPDNGFVVETEFKVGTTISFGCNFGFRMMLADLTTELKVSPEKVCSSDRNWEGDEMPVCIAIECPTPNNIKNGEVTYQSTTYGSKINYRCKQGYKLEVGDPSRKCESDGEWNGVEPICEEIICNDPETEEFKNANHIEAITVHDALEAGDKISWKCADETFTSTCMDDGKWDPWPMCDQIITGEDVTTRIVSSTGPVDSARSATPTIPQSFMPSGETTGKPTTSDESLPGTPSPSEGLDVYTIIGIIAGCVGSALIISGIVIIVLRKRRSRMSSYRSPGISF